MSNQRASLTAYFWPVLSNHLKSIAAAGQGQQAIYMQICRNIPDSIKGHMQHLNKTRENQLLYPCATNLGQVAQDMPVCCCPAAGGSLLRHSISFLFS